MSAAWLGVVTSVQTGTKAVVSSSVVLLLVSGSSWAPSTVAVLVRIVPSKVEGSTITSIFSVSLCPPDSSPTFQITSAPVTGSTVP